MRFSSAAHVTAIDIDTRTVTAHVGSQAHAYSYDRLVLAAGSRVVRPDLPGLREFGFDVDTYDGAKKLEAHLARLAEEPSAPGAATVVVVGPARTGPWSL